MTLPGVFRLSLRARLLLGMLAIAFIAIGGFAIAMNEFVNVLEQDLLEQTLTRELDSLAVDYRDNHDIAIAGARGHTGTVFLVRPGESGSALPRAIERLRPDEHREIHIDGLEYFAARRDVDGARLYLMIANRTVENLEDRLETLGWITLAVTIVVSLAIAIGFSVLIVRPVTRLARRLEAFEPDRISAPIAGEYGDRTMRTIAHSFDDMVARFQDFVARERSFTEDASHELRTPLAVALSTNELQLEQPELSTLARERALRIRDAGTRMQRLIEALLFLARDDEPESGGCDVAEVLANVLPYYRSEIEHKGVALAVEVQPTLVRAPPGVVDCVLHNLLENALVHTDAGEIRVEVAPQRLLVADTGEGINADAIEHIFDRRYRSADSRGYGIGLYLVRRICVRLGWRLCVRPNAPRGTRFEIMPESTHETNDIVR